MNTEEDFLDRMRRQEGWDLSSLPQYSLVLCGSAPGTILTLSLGALSCGLNFQVLMGPGEERDSLMNMSDRAMSHRGLDAHYIPVYSVGFYGLKRNRKMKQRIWIIDAGDVPMRPAGPRTQGPCLLLCPGAGIHGDRWLAFGTDRTEWPTAGKAVRYRTGRKFRPSAPTCSQG